MTKHPPRPKGEGAIYRDSMTGRYIGQLDLGTGANGRRQRRKVTGRSRAEVSKKLAALRQEASQNVDIGRRALTVAELVEQWKKLGCPGPRGKKQASTIAALRGRLDNHLVPAIGTLRLDELRPEHFERWWRREAGSGHRHSTILDYRGDAVQLLNEAVRRRLMTWNPAKVAHMPDAAGPRPQTVLSRKDRDQLCATLEGYSRVPGGPPVRERLEAFFVLLADQGLRPGEAGGLTWERVDLDAGLVFIDRAIKRGEGGAAIDIGPPKTRKSARTLELNARAIAALRRHRAQQSRERLLAGPGWNSDPRWHDLVFTNEIGGPLHPSNVRRSLTKACERAEVPLVTPYELRHTAATILSDHVPLERVADQLGHSDTRMVERVYRHRPQVVRTAAEVEDRHCQASVPA